jgi:hypothetical protein
LRLDKSLIFLTHSRRDVAIQLLRTKKIKD